LDIAANALAELPDAVFERASLQRLDLSSNVLEAVPASLRLLAQLEDLNIAGNPLQLSVDDIAVLPCLKQLTVSHAQLQQCGGVDVLRKALPHLRLKVVPVGWAVTACSIQHWTKWRALLERCSFLAGDVGISLKAAYAHSSSTVVAAQSK
jgi:Leucine rich repeat